MEVLDAVWLKLPTDAIERDALGSRVKMDVEIFAACLEKLWIHGGATVDFAENVTLGLPAWRVPYNTQIAQKLERLQSMVRFTEGNECRMCALVTHFGDRYGAMKPCGICDFCAPEDCEAQQFREANSQEITLAKNLLESLQKNDGRSTGKLYAEHCPGLATSSDARDAFEQLLSSMARAALIELKDEIFNKDGRDIPFRRAIFLKAPDDFALQIRETPGRKPTRSKAKSVAKKSKAKAAPGDPAIEALKKWRLEQAKKEGVPAFRILTDKVLNEIAADRPSVTDELLEVSGLGPRLVTRYGPGILKVLAQL